MLAFLAAKCRAFPRDRKANVAMMFGLSLVPILVATGAGIDFARGVMVHQRMSEALDAAALAVGNTSGKPSACSSSGNTASQQACANLQKTAQQIFDQNYDHTKDASYGTPTPVTISIVNQSVTLTSNLGLHLTLLGIAALNVGQPNVNASSTVVWGQTKLWVALVLDNSGSMSQGDSSGSKMSALQSAITTANTGLLAILKAAASTPGDVQVGLVPFTRSVKIGFSTSSTYLDWGEWEAPPANVTLSGSIGPGSACPFTGTDWRGNPTLSNSYGYYCTSGPSNSAGVVSTIPSSGSYSGYICPGEDHGTANPDHNARYYNGCWDSVITQTQTVTQTNTTPITDSQNCTQVNSGTVSCSSRSGYPSSGSTTSNSVTTISNGYTGDSTSSSSNTVTNSTSDGSKSCSTSHGNTTCTWRRTISETKTDTTVTKTAYGGYSHTWHPNDHSTWSGCVMDRQQKNKQTTLNGGTGYRTPAASDYDESNTQPTSNSSVWDDTQFPTENPDTGDACPGAAIVPFAGADWTADSTWTNLSSKVNAMVASGSTNQAIGVEHGWQMLTTGAPYGTGTLPSSTTKVLILFSDGLNTQDRWYGDGSTEGTTQDGYIDTRENAACTAAKNDGVVIYAIFIHIGTNGSSTALQNCATDSTKYYDLTAASQIQTAFSDIAQKITNLRVSQ